MFEGKIPATENTGLKELMRTSVISCSAQVQTFHAFHAFMWKLLSAETFFRRRWRKRRLSGGQWRTTCFHGFHKSFNEKAFYRTQVRSLPCLVSHSVSSLIEFCSYLKPAVVYFFRASVIFCIENAKFWPILAHVGYLSRIYALFGAPFTV